MTSLSKRILIAAALPLMGLPAVASALPAKLDPATAEAQMAAFGAFYLKPENGKFSVFRLQLAQMVAPADKAVLSELSKADRNVDSFYGDILFFDPTNVNANYKLGRRLKADGFADLAVPYFARAVAGAPSRTVVFEDAARNAYFAEDYRACVTFYDQALARGDAKTTELYLKRGECHAYLDEKDAARADFKAAIAAQDGIKWAYSVRMLGDGVFGGCKGSAASKTASGRKNFDAGKMYEAYRDATAALLCDAKDLPAQQLRLDIESRDSNLAEHYLIHRKRRDNQQEGGASYAMRSKGAAPRSTADFLKEGEMLELSTNEAMARAGYIGSRIIMTEPDNARARLLRARAFNNLKVDALAPQAWVDAGYALKSPDTAPRGHHIRGILLTTYGDPRAALGELDQAIAGDASNPRFYLARAGAQVALKDDAAALPDLDQAVKRTQGTLWTEAVLFRASVKGRLKQTDAAIDDIYLILQRDPDNASARVLEIRLLDEAGRTQSADNRHFNWLNTNEAAAKADKYLSTRTAFLATWEKRKAEIYEESAPDRIDAYIGGIARQRDAAIDVWNRAVNDRDLRDMKDARGRISSLINSAEAYPDTADGRRMPTDSREALAGAVERMRKMRDDMDKAIAQVKQDDDDAEDEAASSDNY